MPRLVRVNADRAGGRIIGGGQSAVYADGELVAVVGDRIEPHGTGPHAAATLIEGSPSVFINGKAVVREGDRASCGHRAMASVEVYADDGMIIVIPGELALDEALQPDAVAAVEAAYQVTDLSAAAVAEAAEIAAQWRMGLPETLTPLDTATASVRYEIAATEAITPRDLADLEHGFAGVETLAPADALGLTAEYAQAAPDLQSFGFDGAGASFDLAGFAGDRDALRLTADYHLGLGDALIPAEMNVVGAGGEIVGAEMLTPAESAALTMSYSLAAAETAAPSDAAEIGSSLAATDRAQPSDAAALTASYSLELGAFQRFGFDGAGLPFDVGAFGDTTQGQVTVSYRLGLADALSASDTANLGAMGGLSLSEAAAPTDTLDLTATMSLGLSEALAPADMADVQGGFVVFEALQPSDQAAVTHYHRLTAAEALQPADAAAPEVTILAREYRGAFGFDGVGLPFDRGVFGDQVQGDLTAAYSETATERAQPTEAAVVGGSGEIVGAETLQPTDAITIIGAYSLSLADALQPADAAQTGEGLDASETLAPAETAALTMSYSLAGSEAAAPADQGAPRVFIGGQEALAPTDTAALMAAYAPTARETLEPTDAGAIGGEGEIPAAETLQPADSLTITVTASLALADPASPSDQADPSLTINLTGSEALAPTDAGSLGAELPAVTATEASAPADQATAALTIALAAADAAQPTDAGSVTHRRPGRPAVPTNVRLIGRSATTATIAWDDPDDWPQPTHWLYQFRVAGSGGYGDRIEAPGGASARQVTLTGLDPNTDYNFRIRAENSEGLGSNTRLDFSTNEAEPSERFGFDGAGVGFDQGPFA